MLNTTDRLAPNREEVAGEVIDGEAIIISLTTGIYFSMDRVGGLIWSLIEARSSLQDIVATIVARHEVTSDEAQADVQRVISDLLEHRLVVVSNEAPGPTDREPTPEQRLPYDAPRLNVYRDMGDLLALDPPAPGLKDIPWKP
jgi:Coenzyme PQQ synthesis protein D (PqqD)